MEDWDSEMAGWVCQRCGQLFGDHEVPDPENPQDGLEGIFHGETWKVYCPSGPTVPIV